MFRRRPVKDFQQGLGGLVRREKPVFGNIALERAGKGRIDGARVQPDANRTGVAVGQLKGEVLNQHVQLRLRRPIGVPAPAPVVADAADPSRQ